VPISHQGEFFDIDLDGDGEIDREEMRRCLRRAANAPDLSGVDMVRAVQQGVLVRFWLGAQVQ
jgi:hypothetical protein